MALTSSPISWAGPRRLVSAPLKLEDLPQIDLVLLSHNHYDHLDFPFLEQLLAKQPHHLPKLAMPLGVAEMFNGIGENVIEECDWWDCTDWPNRRWKLTCTPARHFSGRGLFDRNQSLWCSWHLASEELGFTLYFGGDSGYSSHYQAIRKHLSPPDMAMLPIGAYEPRWFMKPVHMNPEEAIQAHKDLDAQKSYGMHWGTFVLTDEPVMEPPKRIKELQSGLPVNTAFEVLRHGETVFQKSATNLT